jgi:hypothetical protein
VIREALPAAWVTWAVSIGRQLEATSNGRHGYPALQCRYGMNFDRTGGTTDVVGAAITRWSQLDAREGRPACWDVSSRSQHSC